MRGVLAILLTRAAFAGCLISGAVVDADTDKPIANARVFAKGGTGAILRTSNDKGVFCFDSVEPGNYSLVAQRAGYYSLIYGARPGVSSGVDLSVDWDTPAEKIQLRMVRSGSIEGTVMDDTGELLESVHVRLWRKIWDRDEHRWNSDELSGVDTDDRGAYRFAPLAPGTYYVSADGSNMPDSRPWAGRRLDEKGNPASGPGPLTYYGGSVTFERATPISLAAGQQVSNLLVVLHSSPGRALTARLGTGVKQSGPAWLLASLKVPLNVHKDSVFDKNGTAVIKDLRPGIYEVGTSNLDSDISMDVDLTNGDADVVLEPVKEFDIRVSVTHGPPDGVPLELDAHECRTGEFYRCNRQPGGACLFRDLPASQYSLRVKDDQWYVAKLLVDGKVTPDGLLDLRMGVPEKVQVELGSSFATLSGQVQRSGHSEVDLAVSVVWMAEAQPYSEERNDSDKADSSGKFAGERLPPGKYRLFAIEGFDDDLWGSPELAAALQEKSLQIELKDAEDREVTLPLITAQEWAAALRKAGI